MHNEGDVKDLMSTLVVLVEPPEQWDQLRARPFSEGLVAELANNLVQCNNPRLPSWVLSFEP